MAVACGEGDSQIRFEFETPLLTLGGAASVSCIAAFVFYALFFAYNVETAANAKCRRFVRRLRTLCRINPPEAVRIITESEPRGDWFGAEGAQEDLPDMEPENDSDET